MFNDMLRQLHRNVNAYNFGVLIALICYIWQTIDLTIEYTKYETIVEIIANKLSSQAPAISVCVRNMKDWDKIAEFKNQNESVSNYIWRSIKLKINFDSDYDIQDGIIESVTP